jgi:hypothetical protein
VFNNECFLLLKDDEVFTRLSLEHKEFRSVKIFRLSLMVPEISEYTYLYFLIVCDNSVMTYVEKFRFSHF